MSAYHEVHLKPIGEVAEYKRNLIPASIPEHYTLKPVFASVAGDGDIRRGVAAFRDFLYVFWDRVGSDGQEYAKPPAKPSGMADYPFLNYVTNLLVDMGYYGKLTEGGNALRVAELPLCTPQMEENGKKKPPRIPHAAQIACLRFLTLCGFAFAGADLDAKTLCYSEDQPLVATFPGNPILLTGLKAMSIADMELREGRRYWNDHNLLRCDYRLLLAEEADTAGRLRDFLHPLPQDVQDFALRLHRRYTGLGMTCTLCVLDDVSFSYAYIGKSRKELAPRDKYQKRVWAFSYSLRNGFSLFVRAKKTDRYEEAILGFPPFLREKIAEGYGCYRKMGRERCQGDCQGIRIPLDRQAVLVGGDIETFLDHEA